MRELNKTVVTWLEQGKIKEALLGENEFFLSDHTYRSYHNLLLIIDVLISWAIDTSRGDEIGWKFEQILFDLSVSDPWKCADVLLAYTIKAKGLKTGLPCDFLQIFHSLADNLPAAKQKDEKFNVTAKDLLIEIQKRFKQIEKDIWVAS